MNVTFSNVQQARAIVYTAATGVAPGQWFMHAVPQGEPVTPYGMLVLFDDWTTLRLTHCKLVQQELKWGVHGPELFLTGHDRRTYWTGKHIDGRYNVRGPDGTIVSGTERTPQQLAALLWQAMGEPGGLVTALPNNDRPEVFWDAAEAASELTQLCNLYGCMPTLDIANDIGVIVQQGSGASLPENTNIRWTQALTNGVLPGRVEATSGFLIIQSKLKLRPVLPDTDDSWTAADDVAYAPADGWEGNVSNLDSPLSPSNANYTEEDAERAKKLWRAWEVVSFADGTFTFGPLTVQSRQHLLPISDELVGAYSSSEAEGSTKAFLVGTRAIPEEPSPADTNTDEGTLIDVPFTVDAANGLIFTEEPIFKRNDDLQYAPADLFLVCAHKLTDPNTNQHVRYVRFQAPGGLGGVKTARRPDIVPFVIGNYGTGSNHVNTVGFTNNSDEVNGKLDAEIARIITDSAPRDGYVREYNGIQTLSPDGINLSISWSLDSRIRGDDRNCVTRVYRNIEGGGIVYANERLRNQLSAALAADLARTRIRDRHSARRRLR